MWRSGATLRPIRERAVSINLRTVHLEIQNCSKWMTLDKRFQWKISVSHFPKISEKISKSLRYFQIWSRFQIVFSWNITNDIHFCHLLRIRRFVKQNEIIFWIMSFALRLSKLSRKFSLNHQRDYISKLEDGKRCPDDSR